MTARCTNCRGVLDHAAFLCDAETCTSCELERIRKPADEFALFVRALRLAVDEHGVISQTRMRPLIQAIPHKRRGQMYRRATAAGLIHSDGYEQSTDAQGRNTDKPQRRYRWVGKRAAA